MPLSQHRNGQGVGARRQLIEVVTGGILKAGIEVCFGDGHAVDGNFRFSAKAVGNETNTYPDALEIEADGITCCGRVYHLAISGPRRVSARPTAGCDGARSVVVENRRMVLFQARDAGLRWVGVGEGRLPRGAEQVNGSQTTIRADLQQVWTVTQPFIREGASGATGVVQIDCVQVLPINVQIGPASSRVGER